MRALEAFERGTINRAITFPIDHGNEPNWRSGIQTWKTTARVLYTMGFYRDALRVLLAENEGLLFVSMWQEFVKH
jgi:hypothetical protein